MKIINLISLALLLAARVAVAQVARTNVTASLATTNALSVEEVPSPTPAPGSSTNQITAVASPDWHYTSAHGARLDTVARVAAETMGEFDPDKLLTQWHDQLKQLAEQAGKIRPVTQRTIAESAVSPLPKPESLRPVAPTKPVDSIEDVAGLLRQALQKLEAVHVVDPADSKIVTH